MSVIPALNKLRQEGCCVFKANLGYIVPYSLDYHGRCYLKSYKVITITPCNAGQWKIMVIENIRYGGFCIENSINSTFS